MLENGLQSISRSEPISRAEAREIPRSLGVVDFERLYRMHGQRVYNLCWRMAWDKTEAEDLTQEVFIQLFRKIDSYRGEASFTTWLHRVTINVVLMRLRKHRHSDTLVVERNDPDNPSARPVEELEDPAPSAKDAIARLDLEWAIAQLPLGFNRVFFRHDVEGYAHSEIAQMLGISEGTSKSQLHKARRRLRDLLGGEEGQCRKISPECQARSAAPKAVTGRSISKRRLLHLTPERSLLRKAHAPGRIKGHPGDRPVRDAGSKRDQLIGLEVSYGKSKCA